MVCLPQVSREFFRARRLGVVMEERFTILREDLADNGAFFHKLDQALREVEHWDRHPFDRRTVLEVRALFEADVDPEAPGATEAPGTGSVCHTHDYSRFYHFGGLDPVPEDAVREMTDQYLRGCKVYCVFSRREQMTAVVSALDAALTKRGLVRTRDDIAIAFEEDGAHTPAVESLQDAFMGFHCAMSVCSEAPGEEIPSFMIRNGGYSPAEEALLEKLSARSQFNFEQYQVEHAPIGKDIVIRAGAGTGKTYTMISRIGFICYTQNVPLQKMAERIVMITFTNEAADQMEEKIKTYFRKCYLITSDPEYLGMISQIDRMQISTIHSYAKTLIARMGTSFGYGIDLGITSSEFYRRRKICLSSCSKPLTKLLISSFRSTVSRSHLGSGIHSDSSSSSTVTALRFWVSLCLM
jgi:hypothetical protein